MGWCQSRRKYFSLYEYVYNNQYYTSYLVAVTFPDNAPENAADANLETNFNNVFAQIDARLTFGTNFDDFILVVTELLITETAQISTQARQSNCIYAR